MIEKSIRNQTKDYLPRNELLYIWQWGFRANHSTETCLSQLNDMILNGTENDEHTWYDFNRSSKQFWPRKSKNVIKKNKVHRFFRENNKIVSRLFYKQSFFLSIANVFLEAGTINGGVPQGSALGSSLLFACEWCSKSSVKQPYIPASSIFFLRCGIEK